LPAPAASVKAPENRFRPTRPFQPFSSRPLEFDLT
jgi:hypothetical protein